MSSSETLAVILSALGSLVTAVAALWVVRAQDLDKRIAKMAQMRAELGIDAAPLKRDGGRRSTSSQEGS